MRVVLVGSPAARARLREALPDGLEVVAEAPSIAAARAADLDADGYVVAPVAPSDDKRPVTLDDDDGGVAHEALTPREIQVVELLAEGLPNKAIAVRLHISDQTVKFHVSSICGKLGAANRTDAVRRAVRRGIVTL